jgi:mono/diheme cytochrome c family protein
MTTRLLTVAVLALVAARPAAAAEVSYVKDVRPLMTKYCVECHGDQKVKAGYDLDSYKAIMLGGKKGPAVVPGKPDRSLLVRTMEGSAKLMPPKKYEKQPTDAEIAVVRAWVAAGARDDTAAQPRQPQGAAPMPPDGDRPSVRLKATSQPLAERRIVQGGGACSLDD